MTEKRTGKRRKWPWVVGGVLALIVLLPYSLPLIVRQPTGIVHRFEPIRGRVVDDKTEAPLDGAVVVAIYSVTLPSFGGEVARKVEAAEAVTGPDGEFEIPSKIVLGSFFPGAWFNEVHEFYAIRQEYGSLRVWSDLSKLKGPDGKVHFRLRSNLVGEQKRERLQLPLIVSSDGNTLLEEKIENYLEIYKKGR
jgi:hypothetical protein